MLGVTIGDKHSYNDWGLILSKISNISPVPRTKYVDIPLRDGSLDLTQSVTEDIKYKNRTISLTFLVANAKNMWTSKISEIANYLHGEHFKIILDNDAAFYYMGRVAINNWNSDERIGKLVIDCTVEPYKYDVQSSAEEWLWDIFDFETGYIHEAKDIPVVDGTEIIIIGKRKRTYPIITASTNMLLIFNADKPNGGMHSVSEGINKMSNIILSEGENVFTFWHDGTGPLNGTVTIEYTGGSL